MSNILTIAKRELRGYFASPIAYVVIVVFLLLSGICTFKFGRLFSNGQADLYWFFFWHPFLYLLLCPALSMRMWSDERRMGTMELLLTMPITPWQAIIGKFLATWLIVGISLLLTFPIWITINYLGNADNGVIVASYIGSFLMAGLYVAVGAMTSAITRNQVVSFVVSLVILLLLVMCGWPTVTDLFVSWAPPPLLDAIAGCSFWTHFESIQKGVLDSRDILYFVSVMAFCLFTTSTIIRAHRAG